jgi:tripeptidyl-peptidase-1
VYEWLSLNGVKSVNHNPSKDWIDIYIDISSAERLLDTEYYSFKNGYDGSEIIRATEWSIPQHLHEHIDAIQPTTSFMRPVTELDDAHDNTLIDDLTPPDPPVVPWPPPGYVPPSPNSPLGQVCSINGTTPACFAELYGTRGYVQKAGSKNSIGFNNFDGERPVRIDTKMFLERYAPQAVAGAQDFDLVVIANGSHVTGPLDNYELENDLDVEANLDVQTIIGMTYPMHVTAYSTGGIPPQIGDAASDYGPPGNEPYLTWLNYVLAQKSLPHVISTSYGDDEQAVPLTYAKRSCAGFAQLGARGVSVLFAAGDGGVGPEGDLAVDCQSNDGKNKTEFIPSFPPSCPYVTTVGGTYEFQPEKSVVRPANSLGPDGAIHSFYAGGSGFSNYFPRPSYQDGVVLSYLKEIGNSNAGLYNPEGRAYPDLSAQALYFQIVWNETYSVISGTSASTPLMSSIIALVNDALISSGKQPLGFLNPWLYSEGYKGFTDITEGTSGGCNTTGFPVTKGWDAVTGFGTPIFPEILKLLECPY